MYLAELYAENFRIFGAGDDALKVQLQPGLNALVGENDSGKTAIIDAIRYCLWTTSQDYHWFTEDDFFCSAAGRSKQLQIRCRFEDLSKEDEGTFFEYLTTPAGQAPILIVTLQAKLDTSAKVSRISVTTHAGEKGEGPTVEGAIRELLRTTYLKPLRDAEAELSSGRNSRLSQILRHHPGIAGQETDDFDLATGTASTLVGIMRRAEHGIGANPAVVQARDDINDNYLSSLQIGADKLASTVGVAKDSNLARILEKLELKLSGADETVDWTRRGLGYNNALFMSAELLLLGSREAYPLLLIEEPEAHLHPQLQERVIQLLNAKSNDELRPVQVLVSSHSPHLAASIPLAKLILVIRGKTFSLASTDTALNEGDYAFLERFLDVTKSNLFFAKGVTIVEGDAENLLLPAISKKIGRSFSEAGVSIVTVGHTGLFRYSNIFVRRNKTSLPIPVACIRDRDITPDALPNELRGELKKESDLTPAEHLEREKKMTSSDCGQVKTFLSDSWTFEFDLAKASWKLASIMHQSIMTAKEAKTTWPNAAKITEIQTEAALQVEGWKTAGRSLSEVAIDIYTPLKKNQASKAVAAQFAASLVETSEIVETDIPPYLLAALKHVAPEL